MNEHLRRMDDERIGSLETKVDIWIENSKEYRTVLLGKLDKIQNDISNICVRCSTHSEENKSTSGQLKWIWLIIFTTSCSIFGLSFAFGGVNQIVKQQVIELINIKKSSPPVWLVDKVNKLEGKINDLNGSGRTGRTAS